MDAGGRATQDAVAEGCRALFCRAWMRVKTGQGRKSVFSIDCADSGKAFLCLVSCCDKKVSRSARERKNYY